MNGIARSLQREDNTLLPTVLVVMSCFCFGTIPYFARSLTDAGMASYAVAFYRYGLSAVVLLPLLLRLPAEQRTTMLWGVASGVAVGLSWVGYVEALKTVPVSTVGVLYMTYPVFTLLIGWLWFRDKPSGRAFIGASLVVLAAMIAGSPAAVGPEHLPALLVSLTAPVGFGIGINILVHKLNPIRPLMRMATFTVGASLSLLPLMMATEPAAVLPQRVDDWILVAGLALGTAFLPQLVYATFARRIGAARAAVAGSIELPTMFLIGWIALGESISWLQWFCCLLVTVAILLTPARTTVTLPAQMAVTKKRVDR